MAKKKSIEEINQQINRLRAEKRKLEKQEKEELRRARNHMLIVAGTEVLKLIEGSEEVLMKMNDDERRNWIKSRFEVKKLHNNEQSNIDGLMINGGQ